MLDAVIEVTGAEKGLILLHDDAYASDGPTVDRGGPRNAALVVRTARSTRAARSFAQRAAIAGATIAGARRGHQRQHRSQGARDGTPVIVSDALTDAEFNSSESVLALASRASCARRWCRRDTSRACSTSEMTE